MMNDQPRSRILERTKHFLSHPFSHVVIIALAVLLSWPSVYTGFFTDDLYQYTAYLDTPTAKNFLPEEDRMKGPMRMYSFVDGDPERFHRYLDKGIFPWWIKKDIRASMWRPLTGYFSAIDYALWPQSPQWMHIHSLAWLVALLSIASLVYQKVFGPGWAAGLAILLFAINDILAVPVSFLANRHILFGAVFGIFSLYAHDRWRTKHHIGWAIIALLSLCFSLSLRNLELWFLHICSPMRSGLKRGLSAPDLRRLYLLSFLSSVGGFYILLLVMELLDWNYTWIQGKIRWRSPMPFSRKLLFCCLVYSPFPPSDIYLGFTPFAARFYWLIAAIVLFFIAWLFFPVWRNSKIAKFWLLAFGLATIPLCAPVPGGRSLALVSFGAMGFLAVIARNITQKTQSIECSPIWRKITITVLGGLILIRLLIGLVTLPTNGAMLHRLQKGIHILSNIQIDTPRTGTTRFNHR